MIRTEFDGRKALVINPGHVQCGQEGICLGAEETKSLGWRMIFRNTQTGEEFYVYNGKDIRWIRTSSAKNSQRK